jgi:hypothetical protein
MELLAVITAFVEPALDRHRLGGYLLLILGFLLLIAAQLARRRRKQTNDDALRIVEVLLTLLAALCFALARSRLESGLLAAWP